MVASIPCFFHSSCSCQSTDFLIVHGIIAWLVPTLSGQINFGTPSTANLEIYGGVLFAVVERHDGPRRLCNSNDDNFFFLGISSTSIFVGRMFFW